ncbi:MAG: galactokinase [Firmicutes bacterium]|nr:galactokinase [Bacillota bacterium]
MDNKLKNKFEEIYGAGGEIRFFAAAGRVNLIGEHIDYCGGKVLPAGLNLKCVVAARLRSDKVVNLAATTIGDRVSLDIGKLGDYRELKWGNYQAGMAYMMQGAGYDVPAMDLLYDCDVPFGSGLSSSAAIEVATGVTIALMGRKGGNKEKEKRELTAEELVKIAVLAQKAENEYAGVSCGIMDQFASAMAKKDCAILLDCATLEYSYNPLKLGDYRLVIANSNKRRSLAEGKYNERRSECEEGLAVLKSKLPNIQNLSDVTPKDLQKYEGLLPPVVRQRVTHVVGECVRVADSVKALAKGKIAEFGELLNQSHYSLRDLYEVTGVELDTLTHLARTHKGCIGSRMTGAGFGGCTVSLVHKDSVADFVENVGKTYEQKVGLKADFYDTSIEDGARELL